MSAEELAGLVCHTLQSAGIVVTLTGGACVAIWSRGQYVSDDLDFIEDGPVPRSRVRDALQPLGFRPRGRHFVHPDTPFFVEFPTGPLMVGDEPVQAVTERKTSAGKLRLLSPTDCVKDRLAAYFHWNDRQALLVAKAQKISLSDLRRWAQSERSEEKFAVFRQRLKPETRAAPKGGRRKKAPPP
jgi:hypothetical protein